MKRKPPNASSSKREIAYQVRESPSHGREFHDECEIPGPGELQARRSTRSQLPLKRLLYKLRLLLPSTMVNQKPNTPELFTIKQSKKQLQDPRRTPILQSNNPNMQFLAIFRCPEGKIYPKERTFLKTPKLDFQHQQATRIPKSPTRSNSTPPAQNFKKDCR